jgi:hypothetical protein
MNKDTAGDDLGLTLKTGYMTKALHGIFGYDRFRLARAGRVSTSVGQELVRASSDARHGVRYRDAAGASARHPGQ